MAATDLVQVKLRIPEWLRRQVLAGAKKSGRSLNGELSHLIEEGLLKPEYGKLITTAAEVAAKESAARMSQAINDAFARLFEKTPRGLAVLKAVAEAVPHPGHGIMSPVTVMVPDEEEGEDEEVLAPEDREHVLGELASMIARHEEMLKYGEPHRRAELQHRIERLKKIERRWKAPSLQSAEK